MEEIIKEIKKIDSFYIDCEYNINDKTVVLLILKEFIRILVNGVITITIVIEEKDENLSDVIFIMHNPVGAEGLVNDLNVGKDTRKEFIEQFQSYILNMVEL